MPLSILLILFMPLFVVDAYDCLPGDNFFPSDLRGLNTRYPFVESYAQVFLDLTIECENAMIYEWHFLTTTSRIIGLHLAIFRHDHHPRYGSVYKLQDETYITDYSTGGKEDEWIDYPLQEPLKVRKGDVIGLFYDHFDSPRKSVAVKSTMRWASNANTLVFNTDQVEIGKTKMLIGQGTLVNRVPALFVTMMSENGHRNALPYNWNNLLQNPQKIAKPQKPTTFYNNERKMGFSLSTLGKQSYNGHAKVPLRKLGDVEIYRMPSSSVPLPSPIPSPMPSPPTPPVLKLQTERKLGPVEVYSQPEPMANYQQLGPVDVYSQPEPMANYQQLGQFDNSKQWNINNQRASKFAGRKRLGYDRRISFFPLLLDQYNEDLSNTEEKNNDYYVTNDKLVLKPPVFSLEMTTRRYDPVPPPRKDEVFQFDNHGHHRHQSTRKPKRILFFCFLFAYRFVNLKCFFCSLSISRP